MTLSPTTAAPAHEDELVFPDAWLKHLHPRRGGRPGPAIRLDTKAHAKTEALIATARADWLDKALPPQEAADEGLVREIRRTLGGDGGPLGAAALAFATITSYKGGTLTPFIDAWALDHGIAFATVAAVKLGSVQVHRPTAQIEFGGRVFQPAERAQFQAECHGHTAEVLLGPLRRMRALLAACSDVEYAAATAALREVRECCALCRAAAAYLAPTETEWVAESCREYLNRHSAGDLDRRKLLQCSLSTPEQASLLGEHAQVSPFGAGLDTCVTMIDALAEGAVAFFADCLGPYADAGTVRAIGSIIAQIPRDAAFRMLIERLDQTCLAAAVQEAATRFPSRALRILAEAATQPDPKKAATARAVLARHVRMNRDLAISAAGGLPQRGAAIVVELLSQDPVKPVAPAEALPTLLVSPPWALAADPKPPVEPIVVTGLEPPALERVTWTPEEIDRVKGFRVLSNDKWDYGAMAAQVADWERAGAFDWNGHNVAANLFGSGPVEPNRELVRAWRPELTQGGGTEPEYRLWPILRRFEADAIAPLVHVARSSGPAKCPEMLLPVLDPAAARLAADWFARLKTGREPGGAWLDRYGADAAVLLIPDAVGRPGRARDSAEAALRHLAANVPDLVGIAKAEYGADAAKAVRAILAVNPAELLPPVAAPTLPDWLDPAALPDVLMRGGESALPESATRHLLGAFALSTPQAPFPGLPDAVDALDRRSLAEFGWQVLEDWRSVGHPAKQSWALSILGLVGDDETAERLVPLIKAWPGQSGHHRAVAGLDVLAGIGTDRAMRSLNEIAQRSRFKALKDTAVRKMSQIAAQRGMTGDQLADRLVPDLGLDADGGLWLDYGPRRFRVGFDEQLKPFATDDAGKLRKDLPAPNSKDDAELAAAARAQFTALKKQARATASDAIRRLEAALIDQRAWTAEEFTGLLVAHPLLRHVVRRLVWVSEIDDVREGFRVAEDLTLADVADDAFALSPAANVRLAHPLTWPQQGLAGWAEIFADYEIAQPFPQLGRVIHELTDEERATYRLRRFEGRTVPVGRILGLTAHGWRRSPAMDNGIENCITQRIDAERYLVIDLDDGIPVGYVSADFAAEQTLDAVYLAPRAEVYHAGRHDSGLRFADLDPITASELLGQLTRLVD